MAALLTADVAAGLLSTASINVLTVSVLTANLAQIAWALASIVIVEMVRDFYHFLSHHLPLLQRLHNWHHQGFARAPA